MESISASLCSTAEMAQHLHLQQTSLVLNRCHSIEQLSLFNLPNLQLSKPQVKNASLSVII
jgi:hypothetical protein